MRKRVDKERLLGVVMISPSILAVAIFIYYFILWSARVSVSKWTGLMPDYTYVKLQNFIGLFHDPRFSIDIRNTLLFTLLFVSGSLIVGLILAILLDQDLKGESFFRSLFIFPMAISYIVTGVAWRWLMNPAAGGRISGLNLLFDKLGLDFLINSWYTTRVWGIAFIAIPAIWQMSGYVMALYLGGLRSIPQEIREAARVDGATEVEIYRHIILPMIRPITLSALIILGHMSLKVFDLIYSIAGKQVALDVPAIYMWQVTFDGLFYGRGAAIGILLLISVAVLIIPYMRYSLKTEESL
jgi:glucose/mannose transport system permease protein